jgi:methionyl-tRNA synthetase
MLHAIGFSDDDMPQLLVHGWLNLAGVKMSKSAGNIIDPIVLADKYGVDALRYYLMSDVVTGQDADFSEERLIERYNADLANNLGNLLNRALNMTHQYRKGELKRFIDNPFPGFEKEKIFWARFVSGYRQSSDKFGVDTALDFPLRYSRGCNEFVEMQKPWVLAKDSTQADCLDAVLYTLADSLRIIAILISPVLPKAAHGIFDQLNWKIELSGKEERFSLVDAEWGRLPDGHVVGKPVPLFPRIETT